MPKPGDQHAKNDDIREKFEVLTFNAADPEAHELDTLVRLSPQQALFTLYAIDPENAQQLDVPGQSVWISPDKLLAMIKQASEDYQK